MRTDINSKLKLGQLSKRYYCPESEVDLASLTRFEKVYTKIVETPNEGAADSTSPRPLSGAWKNVDDA